MENSVCVCSVGPIKFQNRSFNIGHQSEDAPKVVERLMIEFESKSTNQFHIVRIRIPCTHIHSIHQKIHSFCVSE